MGRACSPILNTKPNVKQGHCRPRLMLINGVAEDWKQMSCKNLRKIYPDRNEWGQLLGPFLAYGANDEQRQQ